MGRPAVSLRFARPHSVLRYFPRAVLARREPLLPDGVTVPRLEGEIERARAASSRLAQYRDVCGLTDDGLLPIAYPHVLAMPLHVALMTHPSFVVRLMGLVHIANEIEWRRPLPAQVDYRLRCWVEGHQATDRGQEFQLFTELWDREGIAWCERCTLLARRRASGAQASRVARATLKAPKPPADAEVADAVFSAERAVARRYGRISGDLNPIHLADFCARWYGFDQAVAHGMWSLARSLAALGPALTSEPCRLPVEFKLPLFLPSSVRLQHWREEGRWTFVLRDPESQRPHLAGTVERP